jgi:hypothetical protein
MEIKSSINDKIQELYPDVKVYVSESPHQIYVHNLEVPKELRGQGIGSNIIKLIQKFAKEVNKPVVLEPDHPRGVKSKLQKFYKNLGFINNRGRNIDYTLSRPYASTMYWKFKEWLENKG